MNILISCVHITVPNICCTLKAPTKSLCVNFLTGWLAEERLFYDFTF